MVTSFFKSFGFGGSAPSSAPVPAPAPVPAVTVAPSSSSPPIRDNERSAVRALPGSWYISEELYQLERRAIFSRKWIMITHKVRLQQTGDWLRYEVANFGFVLCRDQDGNINGFRDACDIDEIKTGLLPIHVHVDCNGFIWVNLDGREKPEIAWEDEFRDVDKQERYQGLHFDEYNFDHSWEMNGPYNWKILADNYNECYHCATTHPDLNALTNLESYNVEPQDGYILHFVATKAEQEAKGMRVHPTYFFPSTSMNISKNFFMLQRFVPHGPNSSTMRYEVYRHKDSPDEDFRIINEMYKRVMSEDKALCEAAQRNVNAGIFINGEMHPRLERGPLYFQKLCRESVTEFHQREVAAQEKIWVAAQQSSRSNLRSTVEFDFGLDVAHQPRAQVVAH